MPQIRLEYSANLGEFATSELFSGIHEILTQITDIKACKSRAVCQTDFYVGDGDSDNAFVFLQISVLPGRDHAEREAIGKQCFDYLQDFFREQISQQNLNCNPTVEIRELEIYFK